jgi:formylglycine-generating enzyme required for sulfatase activity
MFAKAFKFGLIVIISIILVSLSVDAADHRGNFKESIIGSLFAKNSDGPCPPEMVFVSAAGGGFCADKYEASAGAKCPYQDPANEKESSLNINHPECLPEVAAGKIPWRNLTQIQAVSICAKAGKRLPTGEEWFATALGTPDKTSGWTADDCQVSSNWKSQPGETGSGRNCFSYTGAYDMVGNVWEWVKGEINDGVYNGLAMPADGFVKAVNADGLPTQTDPDNAFSEYNNDYFWIKAKGLRGLARGGYWENGDGAGQYSVYAVTDQTFVGTGVGFRCVKDAAK